MKKDKLIKFFSEFWRIKPEDINDELCFDSDHLAEFSSVRFYQFIAALESNYAVRINNLEKIVRFKDLVNRIKDI